MTIDPNILCPCGSGRKYKNCCLIKTTEGYKLSLKGKHAEQFVYELSQKTFFMDWCYPNPRLPNGKEICDLLIIFDDVAIIWQIKDLKVDENGKYKKRDVEKNIHQLLSAKRRLFELKLPITLENPRRGKEVFDSKSVKHIYLISALLGQGEDFFEFLKITEGDVIHTFTRRFTEIALTELDTIKDFEKYLAEKEAFTRGNSGVTLTGGEEELLSVYLTHERSLNILKEYDMTVIEQGLWTELQTNPDFIEKKKEDQISYGWDDIISRAHLCGGEYEKVARELARSSRFERRVLSKAFFEGHVNAHKRAVSGAKGGVRRMFAFQGTTYCFLFLEDTEPRERRKSLLGTICFIARGLNKDIPGVIGIATEDEIRPICSYDFCLLYLPVWTDRQQNELEILQKKTRVFTNYSQKRVREDEYPNLNRLKKTANQSG